MEEVFFQFLLNMRSAPRTLLFETQQALNLIVRFFGLELTSFQRSSQKHYDEALPDPRQLMPVKKNRFPVGASRL